MPTTPLSILDLAPIVEGGTPAQALANATDIARHADGWGYRRYWLAEHHNMVGIASAATAVVIGHIAANTQRIRVGAGGVMLPNHAPLVIAEQFGTLESLYPGRIDLGLGRAPGTDQLTARALRRNMGNSDASFPQDVVELQGWFAPARADQAVQAVPGAGLQVPIWLLGSSLFSAQLAAQLGLPYAFASHFAPRHLMHALALYRDHFQPSAALERPYAMVAANAIAAPSEEEAHFLFSSMRNRFALTARGIRGGLQPPSGDYERDWAPLERAFAEEATSCSVVGSAASIRAELEQLVADTDADELILTAQIYDHSARRRSFEIVAEAWELSSGPTV